VSIIYEALKKTQLNRETKRNVSRPRRRTMPFMQDWEWIDVGLAALIGILLIACVSLYVVHFAHRSSHSGNNHSAATSSRSTSTTASMIEQTASTSSDDAPDEKDLVLNGVLLSDEEKLALINNKTFHVGDMVEGMRIVSIDFNSVKLANGKQLMTLRTAS
jgi:hypothetical protein